jgi:hypothetical protein
MLIVLADYFKGGVVLGFSNSLWERREEGTAREARGKKGDEKGGKRTILLIHRCHG